MPTTPRRAPIATGPTEPASYTLERRLAKAYERLLYAPDRCPEALMRELWGPDLTEKQMYGRDNRPGRLHRLDEQLPEVLLLLDGAQQQALARYLLSDTPDLVAGIRYLLAVDRGNGIKKRETDARLRDTDEGAADAAEKLLGFGHLSRSAYANATTFEKAVPAPAPPPVAPKPAPVPTPPKPTPKPQVLVVVELPRPAASAPRPHPGRWQPWHGQQLALGF